ncbi:MAG: hypothetical protein GY833_22310 [Aestuariibacter sp.]|nr:hypothetical protein [Aestuariibacter sp.]|tara:strand:+ start:9826 stop:10446 length:621 start_codon:yes stop_codon:yes gene_type:complete
MMKKAVLLCLSAFALTACDFTDDDRNDEPTVQFTKAVAMPPAGMPTESSYTKGLDSDDKAIVLNYINKYAVPLHAPHVVKGAYLEDLEITSYLDADGAVIDIYGNIKTQRCGTEETFMVCCIPTKDSTITRLTGLIDPNGRTSHGLYKVEGIDIEKGGACPSSSFYFVKRDEDVFSAVELDVMGHIYRKGIKAVIEEEKARQTSAN